MLTHDILKAVCDYYRVTQTDIRQTEYIRNANGAVEPKQVAAYFLWRRTRLTRDQIANILGYHSGNAVTMARKAIVTIASANKALANDLEAIENLITRN